MRRLLVGLVTLWFATLPVGDAPAQQSEARIALIIANESYAGGNFQPLPGTRQDAAVMESALRRAGFQVTVRSNLGREAMRNALGAFARQLGALGDRGVGFIYYSGHGVGQRGENFLIPIDADVQSVTDLPVQAVAFSEQLESIEFANARATIIVLDACRTSFGRGARGLAAVNARTDTLIAFSTQSGELAADDGLYARTLAAEIERPGADTLTAFARTTTMVANATQRAQVPRFDSGLIEPIVFVATGAATPTAPPSASTPIAPTPSAQVWRDGQEFDDCDGADWCPRMIVIPAGSFLMGSPDNEPRRDADEGPQRRVTIQRFAAGKFEVTFAQWDACANRGGCVGNLAPSDQGMGRGNRPVVNVSWNDAQEYVQWLSDQTRQRYRLLTEAEWEYAARAGTTTIYWTGNSLSRSQAHFGSQNMRSAVVGSYPPNPFGLYDTSGNATEWVQDCYAASYSGLAVDGSAFERAMCDTRVFRGGGYFMQGSERLRAANHSGQIPSYRTGQTGFRVARSLN